MTRDPSTLNHMNQYARYALGASRLEQLGKFKQAAELWEKAYQSPCKAVNYHWAEARYDRCAFMSNLPRGEISERKNI